MTRTLYLSRVPLTETATDICAEFKKLGANVTSSLYYGTFDSIPISSGLGFVTFSTETACKKWRSELSRSNRSIRYLINPPIPDFRPIWENAIILSPLPESESSASISRAIRIAFSDFDDLFVHVTSHVALLKFHSRADQRRAIRESEDMRIGGVRVSVKAAVPNEIPNSVVISHLPQDFMASQHDEDEIRTAIQKVFPGNCTVRVDRGLESAVIHFSSLSDREKAMGVVKEIKLSFRNAVPVVTHPVRSESPALRSLRPSSGDRVEKPSRWVDRLIGKVTSLGGRLGRRVRWFSALLLAAVRRAWAGLQVMAEIQPRVWQIAAVVSVMLPVAVEIAQWKKIGKLADSIAQAIFQSWRLCIVGQIFVLLAHVWRIGMHATVTLWDVIMSWVAVTAPWMIYRIDARSGGFLILAGGFTAIFMVMPALVVTGVRCLRRFYSPDFWTHPKEAIGLALAEALSRPESPEERLTRRQILGLPFWTSDDKTKKSEQRSDELDLGLWTLVVERWREARLGRWIFGAAGLATFLFCLKYVIEHHASVVGRLKLPGFNR